MKKLFAKFLPVILGISVVVGALLFFNNKKKKLTAEEVSGQELQKDSVAGIVPPLPTKEIAFHEFNVNTDRDTTIVFNTGTIITIPKQAFVDGNGDSVKGNVNITYREFHSMGEIVLSGINMRYDSAGVEQYFESAGMFEINGSQNNKDIFIRKEKPIQVAMSSFNNSDDEFGQYSLDKATNTWNFIKKDKVSSIDIDDSIKKERKLRKRLDDVYLKPINTFSIDADEFPHLAEYKDIVFKVSDKTKNYDIWHTCWLSCNITPAKSKGEYRIVFRTGKDTMEVFASNFSESKEFEKRLKQYEKAAQKLAEEMGLEYKKQADEFAKKVDVYLNAIGQYDQARIKYLKLFETEDKLKAAEKEIKTDDVYYNEKIVSRVFSVNNFGIYNSDAPRALPQGKTLLVSFSDKENHEVKITRAYLVEKGTKVTYYIYKNRITYNPEKENVILVITANRELAVIKPEDFKTATEGAKEAIFKLRPKKSGYYSALDINDMLFN